MTVNRCIINELNGRGETEFSETKEMCLNSLEISDVPHLKRKDEVIACSILKDSSFDVFQPSNPKYSNDKATEESSTEITHGANPYEVTSLQQLEQSTLPVTFQSFSPSDHFVYTVFPPAHLGGSSLSGFSDCRYTIKSLRTNGRE